MMETCPVCDGIGSMCLCCKQPIDDCECFEDQEPCPCERCNGRGKVWPGDENDD